MKKPLLFNLAVLTLVMVLSMFAKPSVAQTLEPQDGVYRKDHEETRRMVPYVTLREADIMWSRRIWRIIDMREKMNQFLYYPIEPTNGRKSLISIIMDGIKDGRLRPYDPVMGDDFKSALTLAEIDALTKGDSIPKRLQRPDPPYDEYDTVIFRPLDFSNIKTYQIKEDWVFDRQRSVLEVRIIGICPVLAKFDADGNFRGYKDMFWIYFPELRKVLANEEIYNRFNNVAQQITYDDVFMKRIFSSYIYKEDNVYDRKIDDYLKNGLEALLESDNIKDQIRNFEHDLWEQ